MEGFNYILVGAVWAGAIGISLIAMFFKRIVNKEKVS